jgi:endonuclease/exonuclease/phosphatase family metal-dependent hydrolase
MSLNIKHGAHREAMEQAGVRRLRWDALAEIICGQEPSVVLLQECRGWLADDRRQLGRAEADLPGMRVLVGRSNTGNHPVVVFRREAMRLLGMEDNRYTLLSGYAAARFAIDGLEVDGLAVPLVITSAHLSCYSVEQAKAEAQLVATRTHRYGGAGIMGGDFNSFPIGDPEPDWERVQPYNRMIRAVPSIVPGDDPQWRDKVTWRGNPIVGQALACCDMVDVAAYLADQRGDPSLRAPTGVHGRLRVDQFHVTAAMRPAIVDYWQVDTQGFSDHHAIVTVIDTALIDRGKLRDYT